MTTLHRIHSFRGTFATFFCAVVFMCCAILPTHAQQTNNPVLDTQCQCGGGATVTAPTNAGTEFMLCFEENIDGSYDNTPAYLEVYVASLADTATVTITSRLHPSLNKVFFLQANSSISYKISDDSIQGNPMHDLWIISDEVADNTVVEVQSTAPVVCYGMDYKDKSADAFCALAKESASTDYRVMSYPNSQTATPYTSSQFAVAAFDDNTTVTITPSAKTLAGNPAGVPFTVVLQQGQCIQVQTNPDIDSLDLTGSIVTTSNPVTVYGGHERTETPMGWISSLPKNSSVSRDLLLETMPPTSTWGRSFVLNAVVIDDKGAVDPNGDLMRVLALNDNTVVTVNGNPWITLNHNQFMDSIITGPTLVTSSGPILLGEIEHSDYDQHSNGNGDPFLAIIPPVDQTFNHYTFFLAKDDNMLDQSVIISANTACVGDISLDGTPIPRSAFTPVPGTVNGQTFSICNYALIQGSHTISTNFQPEQGFTILAYGVGNVTSYGYTAGSLLVPKRTIMIEYPPAEMGTNSNNTLEFHNTAYQPAYVDTAMFIPDNFKEEGYGIHIAEDVAYDIGRVDVGGSGVIHVVSDIALMEPVSGTVKIYSHTPTFFNIEPAERHITLYPEAEAGVGATDNSATKVTATPNPFSSYTTINFSVPTTGDITMTLYDALGRAVQHIASSEFSAGPYSVRIERRSLPNGVYVCEINSEKLNIHERIPIVAGE